MFGQKKIKCSLLLEGDGIESRLPFKIFSTLHMINYWVLFTNSQFQNPNFHKAFSESKWDLFVYLLLFIIIILLVKLFFRKFGIWKFVKLWGEHKVFRHIEINQLYLFTGPTSDGSAAAIIVSEDFVKSRGLEDRVKPI